MLGQGSARHIKFQGKVAAHSAKTFDLALAPGPYRFRTVEAGAEADRDIGADGIIPTLVARGADILLEETSGRDELVIPNETDKPPAFVVEASRSPRWPAAGVDVLHLGCQVLYLELADPLSAVRPRFRIATIGCWRNASCVMAITVGLDDFC